ncbi:hypothetical protein EAI_06236 [Harpegnathos saltator]|uniref:Uncharacterized protein n=1 Tax=Harpegnathos saltator TaxID=610380 RepID=E2C195_HARSA|nr:hypothetical protein EAI_06236 [Harpegnathos saltator]
MEGKKEKMMRRKEIREKGIKIDDELTWRERKMRWRLEEIAREERGRGKNVWVKYEKIRIDGRWWRWSEEDDKLRDEKGGIWGEREKGEGENGERESTEGRRMESDVLERSRSGK